MIRFIVYFLVLLGSVWLGLRIAETPGYVLVNYQTWALETTLWFATVVLVVGFFIFYFALRILSTLFSMSSSVNRWSKNRSHRKSRQRTNKGLRALAEAKYGKAEKLLIKSAAESETPLINYLGAAQAAHGRNDLQKRDEYLYLAHQSGDDSEIAVGLTQAQLQINQQQFELAVATLEHINQLSPKHHTVVKLLAKVYEALKDWDAIIALLPDLKKIKIFPKDEMDRLESKANEEHFKIMSQKLNADELARAWKKLPKRMHYDPVIVIEYSNALIRNKDEQHAEKIIRHALDHQWDDRLVRQYAKINLPNSSKQLKHAESWLKKHPEDPDLLVALGQFCLRNKLWGKARSFFETALSLKPTVHALHDLGHVYEALEDRQLALDCYKQALDLIVH